MRVAHKARDAENLAGPLSVAIAFRFPTKDSKRWGLPHCNTPDADNLAKLALDAMQRAGLIPNDSAVWSLRVMKAWSRPELAGMTAALVASSSLESQPEPAPTPPPGPEHPRWLN